MRQDYNGLQRYVHVGTGNYHPVTSRLYADLGLLTADEAIGADATELFNYLTTGFTPKRVYRKLLVAPKSLKSGAAREDPRARSASTRSSGGGLHPLQDERARGRRHRPRALRGVARRRASST